MSRFVSNRKNPSFVKLSFLAAVGLALLVPAQAADDSVAPTVFQAAGPTTTSIQSSVDQFRVALGVRQEINWDGMGSTATTVSPNPLTNFQSTRGALFITPGTNFVQAPALGLANTFGNPSYETIFVAFSPVRLFSPIGSNVTEVLFFVPGGGNIPATTTGFGAVLTDVDFPNGSGPGLKQGNRGSSALFEYFGVNGELLFSGFAPASPGNGSQSFFGVVFSEARIARVRITAGNAAPGPDDDGKADVVMMDDFLFGQPKAQ
ncbi:MAG: hypothetical protein ACRD2Q_07095 [Terriglobales bacterium]